MSNEKEKDSVRDGKIGDDAIFTDDVRKGGTRLKFGNGQLSSISQKDQHGVMNMIAEELAAKMQKNATLETLEKFEDDLRDRIIENADILSWDEDAQEIVARVRNLLRRRV